MPGELAWFSSVTKWRPPKLEALPPSTRANGTELAPFKACDHERVYTADMVGGRIVRA